MLTKLIRIAPLLAVVVCVFLGGCEEKLTNENFASITPGMTMSQVEDILGKGTKQEATGVNISAYGVAGGSTPSEEFVILTWRKGNTHYSVRFKDGKVVEAIKG
ncbi:MAG: outer membrane protein assembly factor BamE [Phycisphaerales bacterium]|nr:outer membrane protein assembly factor BamE [Phycisphaerales bacterium]